MGFNLNRYNHRITPRNGLHRFNPGFPDGTMLFLSDYPGLTTECPYRPMPVAQQSRIRTAFFETNSPVAFSDEAAYFRVATADKKFNVITEEIEETELCQGMVSPTSLWFYVDPARRGGAGNYALQVAEFLQICMNDRRHNHTKITVMTATADRESYARQMGTIALAGYQPAQINMNSNTIEWRFQPL